MPQPDIQIFPSPADLAAAAARTWLAELAARPASAPPASVALSGGRITRTFFQSVVTQARDDRSLFAEVHFFWADERCVPPDDPESNFRLADELLFQPLGIAPECIHRIHGELSPHEGAAAAREDHGTNGVVGAHEADASISGHESSCAATLIAISPGSLLPSSAPSNRRPIGATNWLSCASVAPRSKMRRRSVAIFVLLPITPT